MPPRLNFGIVYIVSKKHKQKGNTMNTKVNKQEREIVTSVKVGDRFRFHLSVDWLHSRRAYYVSISRDEQVDNFYRSAPLEDMAVIDIVPTDKRYSFKRLEQLHQETQALFFPDGELVSHYAEWTKHANNN